MLGLGLGLNLLRIHCKPLLICVRFPSLFPHLWHRSLEFRFTLVLCGVTVMCSSQGFDFESVIYIRFGCEGFMRCAACFPGNG